MDPNGIAMATLESKWDRDGIIIALKAAGVGYEVYKHDAAPTVEEHTKQLSGICTDKCAQVKNLFLKDKKGNLYLVTCAKNTKVDLKSLSVRLGLSKNAPVRMANSDVMTATLQVPAGSVTPFAVLNETAEKVVLLLDAGVKAFDKMLVHPMTNCETVALGVSDFESFLTANGRRCIWVDFASSEAIDLGGEGAQAEEVKDTAKKVEPKKDKRARRAEEVKEANDKGPDGPPENGIPPSAFQYVTWNQSIFQQS